MEEGSEDIIDRVRALMPMRTLDMMSRTLTPAEARVVAERQAYRLLRLLGITKPSVEIELVMELPSIEVKVAPNLPLSGASEWVRDHWQIYINADDSLWRCRATLAHELKHILDDPFREELHPDWPHGSQQPPPGRVEEICDYFAGCVLAPTPWLVDAWKRGIKSAAELARLFDVSEALIRVRLRQAGLSRRTQHGSSRRRYTRPAFIRRVAKRLTGRHAKQWLVGARS